VRRCRWGAVVGLRSEDIEEIDSLFYDAKASAKLLAEQKAGYLQ